MRNVIAVLGACWLLAACKTFSPDGLDAVTSTAGEQLGREAVAIRSGEDAAAAHGKVSHLLKRPLTADAAVQIALFNNRSIQTAYNELGIAEAIMIGSSLPPNPAVSLSRISGSGEFEFERRIAADILALATLPLRADIAADRYRQAQGRAVAETLRIAMATRRAYYRAVAAQEIADFLAEAQSGADAASRLASRLGESGALNKLDQAREHVFYADIAAQAAAARMQALRERERLTRLLGLWGGDTSFRLAKTLPALPSRAAALPSIEKEAIRRRVDVQIARIEVETLAKSYGLTQATRFISLLDVGVVAKTTGDPNGDRIRQRGVEVELQVPLFDLGEVRVREAEQTYMAAVNRLTELAVNARSQAREAYQGYRASYDIATHYQREVLPLRKIISDETLLRYNAMQIDVFALLAEARQRITATTAAIETHRDFWLANAALFSVTVGGGLEPSTADSIPVAATTTGQGDGH